MHKQGDLIVLNWKYHAINLELKDWKFLLNGALHGYQVCDNGQHYRRLIFVAIAFQSMRLYFMIFGFWVFLAIFHLLVLSLRINMEDKLWRGKKRSSHCHEQNILKWVKTRFSSGFGLSLKKGVFWKLKPPSVGGYASHILVLQNKPPAKLSRSIWSILSLVPQLG